MEKFQIVEAESAKKAPSGVVVAWSGTAQRVASASSKTGYRTRLTPYRTTQPLRNVSFSLLFRTCGSLNYVHISNIKPKKVAPTIMVVFSSWNRLVFIVLENQNRGSESFPYDFEAHIISTASRYYSPPWTISSRSNIRHSLHTHITLLKARNWVLNAS